MSKEQISSVNKKEQQNFYGEAETAFSQGASTKSPPPFQLKASQVAETEAAEEVAGTVKDAGFGIRINHTEKTLQIVANVYTSTTTAHSQAVEAAGTWNAKTIQADGYLVSFKINVVPTKPLSDEEIINNFQSTSFLDKKGKLDQKKLARYRFGKLRADAMDAAQEDPIGKSYTGNQGSHSSVVEGSEYVGGQTANSKHADMNTHREKGDLGEKNDYVVHEFGHFFGLDDEDGDKNGETDPYYPGDGGTMEYSGEDLHDISDADVEMILQYAKEVLSRDSESGESAIKILESVGTSEGENPLGLKSATDE